MWITRDHVETRGATRDNTGACIWNYMGARGAMWDHAQPRGATWNHVGARGSTRTHVERLQIQYVHADLA